MLHAAHLPTIADLSADCIAACISVNFFSCAVALVGLMRSKGMSSTCLTVTLSSAVSRDAAPKRFQRRRSAVTCAALSVSRASWAAAAGQGSRQRPGNRCCCYCHTGVYGCQLLLQRSVWAQCAATAPAS